jgi:predicted nucleotidyltransferase
LKREMGAAMQLEDAASMTRTHRRRSCLADAGLPRWSSERVEHYQLLPDGRTRLSDEYRDRLAELVTPVLDRYPVSVGWLYGSVARGIYRRDSDIDLIVEEAPGGRLSFGDLGDIQDELERALGVDVDVFTLSRKRAREAFLNNFDRERICIYERKAE